MAGRVFVPFPGAWAPSPVTIAAGEAARARYTGAPLYSEAGTNQLSITPGTKRFRDWIVRNVRGITSGGLSRHPAKAHDAANPRDRLDMHEAGRAIDLMISTVGGRQNSAVGDPVANWLVEHAEEIGVQIVIWARTQWVSTSSGGRWSNYTGRNPHIDHIHMELSTEGAAGRTPWFQSPTPAPPVVGGSTGGAGAGTQGPSGIVTVLGLVTSAALLAGGAWLLYRR